MSDVLQPPNVDFTSLILSISTAAYMGLGVVPVENDTTPSIDLDMAKINIEFLELLAVKTKGNLTADENRLLEQLLFEIKLKFVEKQKQLSPEKYKKL